MLKRYQYTPIAFHSDLFAIEDTKAASEDDSSPWGNPGTGANHLDRKTLNKKLSDVFAYFPKHEGKSVVPVFSSLSLSETMVRYLTERRILAMAMGGGTMTLLNLDEVGPQLRK